MAQQTQLGNSDKALGAAFSRSSGFFSGPGAAVAAHCRDDCRRMVTQGRIDRAHLDGNRYREDLSDNAELAGSVTVRSQSAALRHPSRVIPLLYWTSTLLIGFKAEFARARSEISTCQMLAAARNERRRRMHDLNLR